MRFLTTCVLGATFACFAVPANAAQLLASIFGSHMVLQRDRPIVLWGQAAPGASITVQLGDEAASANAGNDGSWRATLPALSAGGPHRVVVRTDAGVEQVVDDVLVGDVWLCSGQSNMVLQVHRALDSRAEIAGATDDAIRILGVPNQTSPVPLREFPQPVAWQVVSPRTIPDFSAVCYFYARELRRTVKVPMGLVNASWGGSAISSWMSEDALRALGGYDDLLEIAAARRSSVEEGNRRWGEYWERWWRLRSGDAVGREPWHAPLDDTWKTAPQFGPWESWGNGELAEFNGMVWFRSSISLTAAQASDAAVLQLGGIEDVDQTFVNGIPIGNTSAPAAPREYPLPAGVLRAGPNDVLVNVLDTYGTGGLHGPADAHALEFSDRARRRLDTPWRYRPVDRRMGYPPRTPWDATGGLSTIGNAMIAPLGSLGFRGVLWYQGESDVERADTYAARLAALMQDWRRSFGDALPFLVVQLAGYGPRSTAPAESGTARLREAQRQAVAADPHAALAVAVDLGEPGDIHPANKQDVARRLARAARHLIYGEAISPSGPQPGLASREGETVVVTLREVEGDLRTYGSAHPIGFELCAAGSCRYAEGTVRGTTVVLDDGDLSADTVRFCWADSPVCNLYDAAGLPVVPFETRIGQGAR